MYTQYPWLESLLGHWRTLYTEKRLHHALLLIAPQGMGRHNAVHSFANVLLCQNPHQGVACNECHSCQLFNAQTHPDLYHLAPETAGKQIGIDAVRKANDFAWKTSSLGARRVIIIECAELLGEAAANALLKTLEEPPQNCHFLLYSDAVDRLLPTIISRCAKWVLQKPNEQHALNWISDELRKKGITIELPVDYLRLHSGSPLATLDFVLNEENHKLEELLQAFTLFVKGEQLDFQSLVKLCDASFPSSLHWLSYFLLDVVKFKQGTVSHLVFSQKSLLVQGMADEIELELLFKQYYQLNRLTRALEQQSGLNKTLLVTSWLLDF